MQINAIVFVSQELLNRRKAIEAIQQGMFSEACKNIVFNTYVTEGAGENFSIASARNKATDKAIELNAEWLLQIDCDIILANPIRIFPSTGFGGLLTYFQKSFDDWPANLTDGYGPSSMYLLHRDVFIKNRFFEEFKTMYWEDYDFFHNVLTPNGVVPSQTDLKAIHVWHECRIKTWDNFNKNKALYESRKVA